MPNLDRRTIIHAGIAAAIPAGLVSLLSGCQQAAESKPEAQPQAEQTENENTIAHEPESEKPENTGKKMQIQYLEIVTPEVDAICKQYSEIYGVTFSDPIPNLGNAKTAELDGGSLLSVRAPMREDEAPVVRPYMAVEDIEKAVAAAKDAGAEIAIPKMEIPDYGTIAIVILGGIECGFWQT